MVLLRNVASQPHLKSFYLTPRTQLVIAAIMLLAICVPALAQRPTATQKTQAVAEDPLDQFNASVEELVKKVWPSVVQIQVTSYGPREESDRGNTTVTVGRQRSVGSGFVIDP